MQRLSIVANTIVALWTVTSPITRGRELDDGVLISAAVSELICTCGVDSSAHAEGVRACTAGWLLLVQAAASAAVAMTAALARDVECLIVLARSYSV
ncbi:hypothetical protein GCM10009738_67780 [Kitasatospora viridis]